MSKESVKKINKAFKVFMFVLAAGIAVAALIGNSGHLVTAAVVFAIGLECEIVNKENYDLL